MSAAMCFAESWSGYLVDSKCFAAEERNVNPTDTTGFVDRDRGYEIHYCRPTKRTKLYAIVEQDGLSFTLDPSGDTKAADLMRTTARAVLLFVSVTGEKNGNAIKATSISLVRQTGDLQ